ncbi:electron transport complex subunit RsxE [Clostridium sporogenes]|jgi:electron transport complex protein RnfE|uniref:Ion-translocating oxidoreductase complex subunit E n=1 Tax=Clostridium sporogenes TaxID=1509 RepID=A0ABX4K969_CLOSG|nr:electron transport complex subunit E [Clostridium sporogenes]EHN16898.1 electron transport complex RsxE subunit [Clostridium sporogenes PA 3679]KYN76784.1 electron transport complex subunit RsxE [Clostridium sporogenes]MBA4506479.1 electron transport complex subunit E [Clostridium sporogenes]MBW5458366.1 RnfABCDGE type electron transport complex subunit E [Clostridium sporogenes]MCW6061144.1 electron transport complex subunit E [Clostridium sporogenes]
MSVLGERLKNGILDENVIFVQALAMCPTLAVTSSAENGIGMGLAATVVLIGSNLVVSLLRKVIPEKIRIPAFIVIIASFVTLLQFLMQGFVPELYKKLGIFIPLIVVNCVILGRAEAYASKNGPVASIFDGLGQGLGFAVALTIVGAIRELLGAGQLFGHQIMPSSFQPALIMILAPGAFFTLGILMAIMNSRKLKKSK